MTQLPKHDNGRKRRRWTLLTPQQRVVRNFKMAEDYRSGLPLRAVAERHGVSRSQAAVVLRDEGLSRPRGRPSKTEA